MRTMTVKAIAAASVLGFGIGLAGAQPATTEQQQFQKQGVAINQRAANSPQYLAAALHTISVQTGVPLATVQAQHKQYPNIGVMGLMAANVLADETKKDPAVFLQAKAGGQTWPQIAQTYNVPLAKLNTRLAKMEQTMAPTGQNLGAGQPATTGLQGFEQHAAAINQRAASSPQNLTAALNAISVQTGVQLTTVQAQHKQYPNIGVAGLLAANVLADQTKKDPAVFLQAKAAGQTWSQIAQANNVPLDKLDTRLANVEQSMAPTGR